MLTKIQPHAFQTTRRGGSCTVCGGWPDAAYHNLELFTDADRQREAERLRYQAQVMTNELRKPLKDISKAAGDLMLVEKYRPRSLAEFCGIAKPKEALLRFAEHPKASNWLFSGEPGTGKTTAALALADKEQP